MLEFRQSASMVFCDRTAIGSDAEKQAGICLGAASVDCGAIAKGQFVSLTDVLKLSKRLTSPTNRRGKTHTSGMEKEISRKIRHTQPLKLNMACFFVDQFRPTDAHDRTVSFAFL